MFYQVGKIKYMELFIKVVQVIIADKFFGQKKVPLMKVEPSSPGQI